MIIFFRSMLARKTEPTLKLLWRDSKSNPQVKFSRKYFRFATYFQTALQGHPESLQYQVPPFKTTGQQKEGGPSPSTLIQIYKQCVRPIFKYDSLSTITTSDYNISAEFNGSKTSLFGLPKYICTKSKESCFMTPLAYHM